MCLDQTCGNSRISGNLSEANQNIIGQYKNIKDPMAIWLKIVIGLDASENDLSIY